MKIQNYFTPVFCLIFFGTNVLAQPTKNTLAFNYSNASKTQSASETKVVQTTTKILQGFKFVSLPLDKDVKFKGRFGSVNPKYPTRARENAIEGVVVHELTITPNGQVESIKLHKGIGAGCDKAAREAVERMAQVGFTPAIYQGKGVYAKFYVQFLFKLME